MEKNVEYQQQDLSLETIVSNVMQIPAIRVDRSTFLQKTFQSDNVDIQHILDVGPVQAGIPREKLKAIANRCILNLTSVSSLASFVAGLPGGLVMTLTVPTDVMQYFGCTLYLAQELAYLYGEDDLFRDSCPYPCSDNDQVQNWLILYCGVMFGVTGATEGIRLLSAQISRVALKKLPQQALMKSVWYPIIKQIGKVVGIKVTKNTVAKGVSKIIPVIGGIVSGGLNFASMMPMAKRLQTALDSAHFGYTEETMQADFNVISHLNDIEPAEKVSIKSKLSSGIKNVGDNISGVFSKHKSSTETQSLSSPQASKDELFDTIKRLAELKELGAITQEEFDAKKAELLSRL